MKKSIIFILLSTMVINSQAMEQKQVKSLTEETMAGTTEGSIIAPEGLISRDVTPATLSTLVEKEDIGIQAESDFPIAPSDLRKTYFSRGALLTSVAELIGGCLGTVCSVKTITLCFKHLPDTFSIQNKISIATIASMATSLTVALGTKHVLLHYLENNLIPGGEPTPYTLHKEPRYDEEGNEHILYYHSPFYSPLNPENTNINGNTK